VHDVDGCTVCAVSATQLDATRSSPAFVDLCSVKKVSVLVM
jgi:hypothetical protein